MQRGYAVLEKTDDDTEQYIISEESFKKCQSFEEMVEPIPDSDGYYTISCSVKQWHSIEAEKILDFPVIVLGAIDLYLM